MIHTIGHIRTYVNKEQIEVVRDGNVIDLIIQSVRERDTQLTLTLDEAQELRDMLTRALEGAEDVRVVES